MLSCSRLLHFCAGHRVHGHENKCRHVHGHNYDVVVWARDIRDHDDTDALGRVIDFSVLKHRVGGWIEDNWDHAMIYWVGDDEMRDTFGGLLKHHKSFELPVNPTAENLARYLLLDVCPEVLGDSGVEVYRVVVQETKNCSAEATL